MNNENLKIGDKVRIIALGDFAEIAERDPAGATERGLVVGNTGTVVATGPYDPPGVVGVRTDNASKPAPATLSREGWAFYPEELEKVEG